MAVAAGIAALAFLAGEPDPTWTQARETLPLAVIVGATVGWLGFPRRPKTIASGALRGGLVTLAGLGLFLIAYASADATIESATQVGVSFVAAWGRAAGRVIADLWLAGPVALLAGPAAGAFATRR